MKCESSMFLHIYRSNLMMYWWSYNYMIRVLCRSIACSTWPWKAFARYWGEVPGQNCSGYYAPNAVGMHVDGALVMMFVWGMDHVPIQELEQTWQLHRKKTFSTLVVPWLYWMHCNFNWFKFCCFHKLATIECIQTVQWIIMASKCQFRKVKTVKRNLINVNRAEIKSMWYNEVQIVSVCILMVPWWNY